MLCIVAMSVVINLWLCSLEITGVKDTGYVVGVRLPFPDDWKMSCTVLLMLDWRHIYLETTCVVLAI